MILLSNASLDRIVITGRMFMGLQCLMIFVWSVC
uniref:Uncharacterized protein n=1 Tax=Rhizophora mucronata TaxID=61149 RepID=A0A2P2NHR5_RHIMU